MPEARALTTLASGFGSFQPGEPLRDVPADVVAVWVAAGVAEIVPDGPAAVPRKVAAASAPPADAGNGLQQALGAAADSLDPDLQDALAPASADEPAPARARRRTR